MGSSATRQPRRAHGTSGRGARRSVLKSAGIASVHGMGGGRSVRAPRASGRSRARGCMRTKLADARASSALTTATTMTRSCRAENRFPVWDPRVPSRGGRENPVRWTPKIVLSVTPHGASELRAASAALRHLTQKRKSCAPDAQVSRIRSPTAIDGICDHESCLARIIAIAVKSGLGTPGAECKRSESNTH
jgi:hypothetical protein